MSITTDKYRRLVESLYKKTIAQDLPWRVDLLDDEVAEADIAGKLVELSRSETSQGEPIIIVRILDEGRVVEKFNDEALSGLTPNIANYGSYWELMSTLHETALRQAKGIDAALDDLLRELGE